MRLARITRRRCVCRQRDCEIAPGCQQLHGGWWAGRRRRRQRIQIAKLKAGRFQCLQIWQPSLQITTGGIVSQHAGQRCQPGLGQNQIGHAINVRQRRRCITSRCITSCVTRGLQNGLQIILQGGQPVRHRIKTHREIWRHLLIQLINPPGQCCDLRHQRLLVVLQRSTGSGIFIPRRCHFGCHFGCQLR